MLFNSLAYAVFLIIVLVLYFALAHRFRWILLLAASYYFYMRWNPELVLLILFTTAVSYFAALGISTAKSTAAKKRILILGISLCLACLFFFKYFNFFSQNVTALLRAFSLPVGTFTLQVILPVGISFYTFQTLSYIIDVYRGDLPVEQHFGYYALYVSFFPQLVAGPIERATNLLPQFHREQSFDLVRAREGAQIIVLGLFKKVVVADMLAVHVNRVYNDITSFDSIPILFATLLFSFQIYCDFSGYSDIAIGSAKLFGIDLMTNFKAPYLSCSIREFWRRWHISLSGWFTDYIYIPLGGSRVSPAKQMRNLMLVFLCSGLWHGASWTFVLWGVLHGLFRILDLFTEPFLSRLTLRLRKVPRACLILLRTAVTYSLVCFSWIFFRANSLSDASYAVSHLFSGFTLSFGGLTAAFQSFDMTRVQLAICLLVLLVVFLFDVWDRRHHERIPFPNSLPLRTILTWVLAFFIVLRLFTAENLSAADFIYFQF